MAEAPMNGQAEACGSGRNARNGSAETAPPAEISAASRDLSLPALTMAFHVACSSAPKRTSRMTSRGKGVNPERMRRSGTRLASAFRIPEKTTEICTKMHGGGRLCGHVSNSILSVGEQWWLIGAIFTCARHAFNPGAPFNYEMFLMDIRT